MLAIAPIAAVTARDGFRGRCDVTAAAARTAPVFARADAEAPWRPDPGALAEHRATQLLDRLGAGDLETAQARAVTDPGWFWGEAVADLDLAWQRPWTEVLDLHGGIE